MGKGKAERSELILLGVFAAFVLAFVWEIRGLPTEAKLLSYLTAPFALGLILFRVVAALRPRKPAADLELSRFVEEGEVPALEETPTPEELAKKRAARGRFFLTIGAAVFLFASIALFGFYWGSGLTLLAWFVSIKRVTRGTVAITIVTPLILYLAFEILLEMGLPKGALFELLGG